MAQERHVLTESDQQRLQALLDHLSAGSAPAAAEQEHLELLSRKVRQAEVVPPQQAPREVVTMNSLVGVRDLEANEKWSCRLAYPDDDDTKRRKVEVTQAMGATILGQRVGDTVEFPTPTGTRQLRIEQVFYQPEAAGDLHL